MPYTALQEKVKCILLHHSLMGELPLSKRNSSYILRFFELGGASAFTKIEELNLQNKETLLDIAYLLVKASPLVVFLNLHRVGAMPPPKDVIKNKPCPLEHFSAYLKCAIEKDPHLITALYLETAKSTPTSDSKKLKLNKELIELTKNIVENSPGFFSKRLLLKIEKISPSLLQDIKGFI